MAAASTPALQSVQRAGVEFKTHSYELEHGSETEQADLSYGEAVAAALGVDPRRLFKTLVAVCDTTPVVAIVPARSQLSLKALARAAVSKKAHMAEPGDAEKWTGYVVGGISPLAQKRTLPTYLDESAVDFDTVHISAGVRGLQIELAPSDLVILLDCRLVRLTD